MKRVENAGNTVDTSNSGNTRNTGNTITPLNFLNSMNTRNSMGKAEFCIEHVIWGAIGLLLYRNLFRCVGYLSLAESRLLLGGIVVFLSVLFGFLEFKRARNGFSVFFNLITGYGLYTVIAYMRFQKSFILITLVIAAILSAACVIGIMFKSSRRTRNRKRKKTILLRRINRSVLSVHAVIGAGLALIVLVLGVRVIFGNNLIHSNVLSNIRPAGEEQSLANNIETIALLEESRWRTLTPQEKIDVLQAVANVERRYLGLPHELNVGAAGLTDGSIGNYMDATHQITVDLDHLCDDSPELVLNTVLHEAYHAYEHRCWDAYLSTDENSRSLKLFRKAIVYGSEFAEYQDGNDGSFMYYYMQACEEDAREYADQAEEDYFDRINEFYGEEVFPAEYGWTG